MPAHDDVNVIEEVYDGCVIEDVQDTKIMLLVFHERLVEAFLINKCHVDCEEYDFHPRGCKVVQNDIQNLMNQGILQVSSLVKNEQLVVIGPCFNLREPVEIPYQRVEFTHPTNCI